MARRVADITGKAVLDCVRMDYDGMTDHFVCVDLDDDLILLNYLTQIGKEYNDSFLGVRTYNNKIRLHIKISGKQGCSM